MTSIKEAPQRSPYKFLTRNLYVTNPSEFPFKKACLQRVYLKHLKDDTPKYSPKQETIFRPFKQNKLFKTLKSAQFSSLYHPYIIESLKASKRLLNLHINFTLDQESFHPANEVITCLKRLPNKIQRISLNVEIGPPILYEIARFLRVFPKLRHFSRWCNKMFFIDDEKDYISNELEIYKKSTLRRKISIFYAFGHNEIPSFQRAASSNSISKEITGLEVKLKSSDFVNYERLEPFFWSENFDALDISSAFEKAKPNADLNEISEPSEYSSQSTRDSRYQEEDDKDTVVNLQVVQRQIIEEIAPFYRFEAFPNLQTLKITQEDALYPLGSFVVDGFAALQKLKDFEILIGKRPKDTIFLFAGFLKFPLFLKRFSLQINFIRGEEWDLLQQFLESHRRLESLHISIREKPSDKSHYKNRNLYLQNIIKSLKDHSSLQALTLEPSFCSLESFSIGLSHLANMKNQLHTFRFQAIDDTIPSQRTCQKRVHGLCEFIKNQNESLQILQIAIPFVSEDKIITKIVSAISELKQLKILDIQIQDVSEKKTEEIQKYFLHILQKNRPIETPEEPAKKWEPAVAKHLLRLENLEDFRFRIGLPDLYGKEDHGWFLDLIKALSKLERLRKVFIIVDDGAKLKNIEEGLCRAVLELKKIQEIYMISWKENFVGATNSVLPELRKTLEKVNERLMR